jgi:hypothetical protein
MISALEIVGVAVASLIGSSVMWLTLGPFIVEKYAFRKLQTGLKTASEDPESPQGQLVGSLSRQVAESSLSSYVQKAIDDPQGPEGQTMGNLSQLIFYYSLDTMTQLMPENPNEPAHPAINAILRRVEDHVSKSMFAAFGKIVNNMQKGGIDVKANGVDVGGIIGMLGGGGNGPAGGMGQIGQLAGVLGQLGQLGQLGGGQPQLQSTSPPISKGSSGIGNW